MPHSAAMQGAGLSEEVFALSLEVWKELGVVQESGEGQRSVLELLESHIEQSL